MRVAFENACAALAELDQTLRNYEDSRKRLFHEHLEKNNQAWCSLGQHAVPKGDTRLVACCHNSWEFHRACHACLSAHLLRRGDGPETFVPVYKRDGRYYQEGHSGSIGTFYTPTDWTEPSSVPPAAIKAFSIPPKLILQIQEFPGDNEQNLRLVQKDNDGRDSYSYPPRE